MITDRETLGLVMCNWHRSGGDPVYAVGSYFVGGHTPETKTVERARDSLARDLRNPHKSWHAGDLDELADIVDALDRILGGTFDAD